MHDFFTRQEDARHQSARLLFLFGLAVAGVALAVYLTVVLLVMFNSRDLIQPRLWHPQLFLWTATATVAFISAASYLKFRELRSGGAVVAMALGAKPVPPHTQEPRERVLRNVVEEMAIASGMPVPDVYLLERERGINAFAAGFDVNDAVVCVTRGAMELLGRDELQGVIAHEFSHILNGDMRLNIRMLGLLNGILAMSQAGKMLFRGLEDSRSRNSGAILVVATALYGIGYVGYFFGQLIRCAVSRQREYLGDASAVQFTRNPGGLAGALKKIGGLTEGSRLIHPRADEVSHMFFGNGLKEAWLHALDTHPPLPARILRLEPRFDGSFPKVTPLPAPPPTEVKVAPRPEKKAESVAPVLTGLAVAGLLERVGEPMQEHIDMARRLLDGLPEQLRVACRDPFGACAVVYGLLLDPEPALRGRQLEMVSQHDSAAVADELRRLLPALNGVAAEVRLPLVDLALPSLRSLSRDQFLRLKETVTALATADGRESLFEFTLRYVLMRHLEPRFSPRPPKPVQIYGIRGVQRECACVLTLLARVGHREEVAAGAAFARGALVLHEPKTEFTFLPAAECKPSKLEQALTVLEGASPPIKRKLLAACLECLIHDRVVTVQEVELFRAIADALGCPVPPWLDLSRVSKNGSQGLGEAAALGASRGLV